MCIFSLHYYINKLSYNPSPTSDEVSPCSDSSSGSEDRNILITSTGSSLFDEENSYDYEHKKQLASKGYTV